MAKSKTTKKTVKTATPNEYSAKKLAIQGRCKIGAQMQYHGRNTTIDGQRVKVTGHESVGGVFVEYKGTKFAVSPFSLLGITIEGKAKTTVNAKVKAKATKPAPKKSAPTKKPAPTPAAPPADVAKTTKAAKAA